MNEDAAPAEQDQPDQEAPETDQPESTESFTDFDASQVPEDADREWLANRYQQMQGDYTRKTQEIGEARREAEQAQAALEGLRDPKVAPAILSQLGYSEQEILEMFGYETDSDEDDLYEDSDPDERIGRLEQTVAQQQQEKERAEQEEAVTDYIATEIEALEKSEGREFDAKEHRLLDNYARANWASGRPDVKGAFDLLSGVLSERQKAWVKSKEAPRAPGGGKPGSRQVDLSKESHEEFIERMAQAGDEARGSVAA